MRTLVAFLVLWIAASRSDACPTIGGRWPWKPSFVLRGARYDPDHTGPYSIPPRPRLFVLRKFDDTVLPVFRTPDGKAIPRTVTACGQLVFVDLDIDDGTVIVDDSARDGRTETFVIRAGLPATTRRAELATDAIGPRIVPDSDAVAFRIDSADGTQTVQFNGPYVPLPAPWRGARVVALYANGTEEVIWGRRSRLPRYPFFVLAFALLGVVWLVTRAPHRER